MKIESQDRIDSTLNLADEPEVSIVITAYNAASFIKASVSAALAQDHPRFEVIVVDDASSDQTGEIIQAMDDRRLRYIRMKRIGRSRALNEGISLARGRYIAINDADDLSLSHRLTYVLNFLRASSDVAFVATAYTLTTRFHSTIPEEVHQQREEHNASSVWIPPSRLYRSNPLVHSTIVFQKSIWKSVGGYDEGLSMCIDYDFYLRAMQFGQAAWLPNRTVLWYRNMASYYKKKGAWEYLNALFFIKQRAHRLLNLPLWVRLYDAIPLYQSFMSLALRSRRTALEVSKK